MEEIKYKKIISVCTSGSVKREDLISHWYFVFLDNNEMLVAYHHKWFGWMIKGKPVDNFIYGYVPLNKNVVRFEFAYE